MSQPGHTSTPPIAKPPVSQPSDVATSVDRMSIGAEDLRYMTKVARLYHEQGIRQRQIAEQLRISQARVSRLLRRAEEVGIVRTVVLTPPGVYGDLEDALQDRYGLADVVIADAGDLGDDAFVVPALASAAANYLETTLLEGERIGISSWSSVLLATVDQMRKRAGQAAEEVVQVLGGAGVVVAQEHATRLTGRLASLMGARAVYLPAPGLLASSDTRAALMSDDAIKETVVRFAELTVLLAGIGSLEPSKLLQASGNSIKPDDEVALRAAGAVGDVCMRYFDAKGRLVRSEIDDRIVGIDAASLRKIPRRIGVAGGSRKREAIRAAVLGGWINILVTDQATAEYLLSGKR